MARDPQKLRKAYESKLGKDLVAKLSDDQIASLSQYYNSLQPSQQSNVDSELVKGMGEFLNTARSMADPLKYPSDRSLLPTSEVGKYQPEDKAKDDFVESVDKKLDEKLGETSDSIMSEIDKLIAEYQKKVVDIQKSRQEEEEKVPEGLDDLLKDIKSEVGGNTPKKSGALAVIPKPDKAKEQELIGDENIDPEILKALGLNDVTDLDYGEYSSLLKEKMMANQMGSGGGLDQEKLKDEYKRVRGKTGSFKVKNQKMNAQSFVAKTKPRSDVSKVTPQLPPAQNQETEESTQKPEMDKTLALVASKLSAVDKNVQQTAKYLNQKDKTEEKDKKEERYAKGQAAKEARENRTEKSSLLSTISKLVGGVVAPIKNLLGGFFDFLKRLGFAIFIMELMRFLENPAKFINNIIDWTNKQIKKLEVVIEDFVIDKMVQPLNGMIRGLNDTIGGFVDKINPILEKLSFLGIETQLNKNDLKVPEINENDIRNGVALPQISNVDKDFLNFGQVDGSGNTEATPQETMMGGDRSQSTSSLAAKGGVDQGERAKNQVSEAGFDESDFILYRDVVAEIESGGEYDIQGGSGDMYAGRYQMGAAAREDAARLLGEEYQGDSEAARKTFREDKQMQERYFAAYSRANHGYLMKGSPEYKELSQEGKLQVLGYAHNAGWSRAADWLKSGMSGSFKDGFGTRSDKYSTSIRSAQQQVRQRAQAPKPTSSGPQTVPMDQIPGENATQEEKDEYFRRLDAGELTSPGQSPGPTKSQQQQKLEEQRKRTEELMKGDPRFAPQVSVPTITPPVQKAALTTIGGGSGGTQALTDTSIAASTQSQISSFSAIDPTNLSIMGAKAVYGVIG